MLEEFVRCVLWKKSRFGFCTANCNDHLKKVAVRKKLLFCCDELLHIFYCL
jgi:hypothetical protein